MLSISFNITDLPRTHLANLICLSACLSRRSLPQGPTEVSVADYDSRECPMTVPAAIIHYEPDPNDCAVIKKDQVHNLVHFPAPPLIFPT